MLLGSDRVGAAVYTLFDRINRMYKNKIIDLTVVGHAAIECLQYPVNLVHPV